ncbi:toll/interleukin-1 receptor domain-containing protein [Pseudoalteromonas sp. MMG012]|uniref:toll/interleukin-1 receptor domain-containing protein n=1 Tax=Pseudoalteromonas sp. MMG012 TaxID=2822686 RepID=UPI001B3A0755|nr:toll/interleukin-1 receptor domain-containing protein [Pseudoalteromonas sp. MMG012]MBQ4851398.1 toll/interleukin-1 receptor domain-containing protein [Pseudoalteromonas sp. MMG012]
MNVFLSWSGDRSKAVADLLDDWFQCVLQALDPWMSSKDIERGSLWFSEINDQLQDTSIGVICLTQENKNKPWILFEAGALAKGLADNRICTFLIDLEPIDVGTPLSQFNHTLPNKDSMFQLVRTLNNTLKDKGLNDKTLETVFNTYWEQFEKQFKAILKNTPEVEEPTTRTENDILKEILATTRSMESRVRRLEGSGHYSEERKIDKDITSTQAFIVSKLAKGVSESSIVRSLIRNFGITEIEALNSVNNAQISAALNSK